MKLPGLCQGKYCRIRGDENSYERPEAGIWILKILSGQA